MSITLVLGAQDHPTDGVDDFAQSLASALRARGMEADILRVPWDVEGWHRATSSIRKADLGNVALLQYTHLAWSRRGFPFGVFRVIRALRSSGARVGVVLHDPSPYSGRRLRDRARRVTQRWTVRRLARTTNPVFSTLEPTVVRVLQGIRPVPTFLPAGSNVPAMPTSRRASGRLRIAVFSITEQNDDEARLVASIVGEAATRHDDVSLVVFGRGAPEAEPALRSVRDHVPLDVMGVIPALEISRILAGSDAMLFVRGEASSRRGTIIAAIANGLPIVAYRGRETGPSIEEAGLSLCEPGDTSDAAARLVRIARDHGYATELRARQRDAYDRTFSWERLAETVVESL